MKSYQQIIRLGAIALVAVWLAGCAMQRAAEQHATEPAAPAKTQELKVVETPQHVKDHMLERGQQDAARPVLTILEPRESAIIRSSTVLVRLDLSGDLKGYQPGKDPESGMGNHVHVILDNQSYAAYYHLDAPFELRNVAAGRHTLRVFASRPWHESYKNDGAFQIVTFTVRPEPAPADETPAGRRAETAEGLDAASSQAGAVDAKKPLLTYSRPKGEYKGSEADRILIDYWLTNAQLRGDGGRYRVRYVIDGGAAKYLEKWQPVWLSGWNAGKHTIKLELVDEKNNVVANGDYNSTTREITVAR